MSLIQPHPDVESIDQKVFIPAHQRVSVMIHLYVVPDMEEDDKNLRMWAGKKFKNLDGWVLFDKKNRYQITFPKGW